MTLEAVSGVSMIFNKGITEIKGGKLVHKMHNKMPCSN